MRFISLAGQDHWVIHHESLAGYIRPTRTRPLIVKLHGDNRLSPQNTADETQTLKDDIKKQVLSVLHDRGLIFIGYGGNDTGIKDMLQSVPAEGLLGVFWVNLKEPQGTIRPWLESRNAIWVEKGDFDELMLLTRDIFDLPHPDRGRFDEVFGKYKATYDTLSARVISLPSSAPDSSAMKEAVKRADESLPDGWSDIVMAERLRESDPDHADSIYLKGLKQFPSSAPLVGAYALFLEQIRKDYERAEEYFKKAIELDPKNAHTLGNYANFLHQVRKDYDSAEEYYKKAINLDLKSTNKLGNYAGFLLSWGRTVDGLSTLEGILPLLNAPGTLKGLAAECWFYALAHRPAEQRDEALRNLKRVLQSGERSPNWDLSQNIVQARKDGHPDVAWLEKLATVISDGADIGILDIWPKWKKA